jgi:hypothetical protein
MPPAAGRPPAAAHRRSLRVAAAETPPRRARVLARRHRARCAARRAFRPAGEEHPNSHKHKHDMAGLAASRRAAALMAALLLALATHGAPPDCAARRVRGTSLQLQHRRSARQRQPLLHLH